MCERAKAARGAGRYVSPEQVQALLDYMGQHVDLATGSLRAMRFTSRKLWGDLARTLNNFPLGARKTADGWSKYWSDFKNKLKNKMFTLNKRKRLSTPQTKLRSLNRLEKRALKILGPDFERKLSSTVDLSKNTSPEQSPPEVKLEAVQVSPATFVTKAWPVTENNNGENQCEGDNESNGSGDSNREFDANNNDDDDDDEDNNSEEPVIHGIYPNWLVAIEKKRAEADFNRAKAEEHRANASAKNAEAALLQAEALKKLADAAQIQAEAIMKIAIALESRSMRDHILPI